MKKNLLIMAFGFSFLFFGIMTTEVAASTGSVSSIKKSRKVSFKASKAIRVSEFNKKYAELKAFCEGNMGPDCDAAIQIADEIAQEAWSECNRNMNVCQAQQDYALGMLEWAMDVCRAEEPLISAQTRKNYLQASLKNYSRGKIETTE